MTASASRDDTLADQRRQRVDTCRKYWFEGRRFNAALMSCRFGRQPLLECLFDQPKRCKGRMLAELTPTLPTLLREIEGQLLWYAAFPLELTAHTNSVVRAAFLQWLITNPLSVKLIHSHGIHVTNLTIDGDLDLHSVTIGFPVVIRDSHFTGGIILTDAETRFMSFEGSTCAYINADQIKIRGGLKLTHRFKAEGRVDLTEARISGDLDCAGGHFNTKHKHKIQALTIDRAAIEGGVFLTNGFAADGEVSLRGAQITGNLDCSAGSFKSLRSRRRKRRRATRGLSAARALGTTPTEHELYALNTSLATVHGDVRLTVSNGQAFHAEGHVLAIGMRVGGDFDCTNGCLSNLTGVPPHAISLDRSIIGGSVFLRNGFSAHGQVRLIGTKIIGDLDCSAGRLNINRNATEHTEPAALEARSAEINDCVNLCGNLLPDGQKQAFETNGWINFDFARIGGDMCVGQDEGNNAKGGAVLNTEHVNIRNAKIEGALRWKDVECKQHVMLSIDNTTVGGFITNTDNKRWPHALSLRNFVYRYISFRDSNDDDCKDVAYQDWLKRHNEFNPQVYEQLATVLSRSGQHTTANEILEDKEEGRRKTMKANCSAGSMSRNWWVMFALR